MKKLVIAFAALAVIGLALAPTGVSQAQAQTGKRLWQGWMEEIQKIGAPAAPAKAAPAKAAPAKKK